MRRNSQEFFVGLWFNGKGLQWDMRATLLTLSPIENENEIKFDGKKFKIVSFTSLVSPDFTTSLPFHHREAFSFPHAFTTVRLFPAPSTDHSNTKVRFTPPQRPGLRPAAESPDSVGVCGGLKIVCTNIKKLLLSSRRSEIVKPC